MKYLILIICLGLVGCASTQQPTDAIKTDRAYQIITDAVPYIKGIAEAGIKLSLQYAERDQEKRDDLKLQIHVVAVNLEALLAKGDFNPGSVTAALRVKEDYINSILSGISIAYTAAYEKLAQNDQAELAIRVLRSLSQGVAAGTE